MAGRRKAQDATLTRKELEKQVKSFLKEGGKIEKIPTGQSGQQDRKGPVHIRI